MNYRILIPVATPADRTAYVFDNISDKTKLTVINNFDDPEVALLCKKVQDEGAEVLNHPENLGVGSSWNVGLRQVAEGRCDYILILSAGVVIDKPILEFLEVIEKKEEECKRWTYVCNGPTNKHYFITTKLGVEKMGYYDENFWPAYVEDMDYCYRSKLNNCGDNCCNLNIYDYAHSFEYSLALRADKRLLRHYQLNVTRFTNYYIKKWGGYQNTEKYTHPFNNPNIGVNDWILETKGFIPLEPK